MKDDIRYKAFFEVCKTVAYLNNMADAFGSIGLLIDDNNLSGYWTALTSVINAAVCILGRSPGKEDNLYNTIAAITMNEHFEEGVDTIWKTWKESGKD